MSFTVWFMGRPASGKSTLAKRVEDALRERGHAIENLDGDEIRENLYPDLGFSREDRAVNNRRTAYICRLLNRNGISVVNAMITPFRESQFRARELIETDGTFVLVYVKCSVEEAKRRDPKGMYKQAVEGKIENFTGINHPFQEPHSPEIIVDTEQQEPAESVEHVLHRLEKLNVLEENIGDDYGFKMTHTEIESVRNKLAELGYTERDNEE
jgi:adenylylsulfate kinase